MSGLVADVRVNDVLSSIGVASANAITDNKIN